MRRKRRRRVFHPPAVLVLPQQPAGRSRLEELVSTAQQKLSRVRTWATSGQVANVATAIADGALSGHQPWWVVAAHLVAAALMPAPVASKPK